MRPPVPDREARTWAAAWTAFAADDAGAGAPPELEWRVLQAGRRMHTARRLPIRRSHRRWAVAAVATAASLMLVAAGLLGKPPGNGTSTARDVWTPASPAAGHPQSVPPAGVASTEHDRISAATPTVNTAPSASAPLAVDPASDTETVQLVRIRVPVGALLALGVTTTDPDASGVVDVDVTVGDDGLAREIRGIRAVPHAEHE